eukprot:scaffold93382_cov60-Phaeocystis_antarctica.AAC.1
MRPHHPLAAAVLVLLEHARQRIERLGLRRLPRRRNLAHRLPPRSALHALELLIVLLHEALALVVLRGDPRLRRARRRGAGDERVDRLVISCERPRVLGLGLAPLERLGVAVVLRGNGDGWCYLRGSQLALALLERAG